MPRPGPRLLIGGLVLAAAALLVAVALRQSDKERERPSASETKALSKLPKINRCVRPGVTRGDDDEGLDVETLSERVAALRQLSFREAPDVELVSTEEIDERIGGLFEEEYSASVAEVEQRVLTKL